MYLFFILFFIYMEIKNIIYITVFWHTQPLKGLSTTA